jgi:hypothetical protein
VSNGRRTVQLSLLAALLVVTLAPSQVKADSSKGASDRCSLKAQELFGQTPPPIDVGDSTQGKGPKLLHLVKPSFPESARTVCPILRHEALVAPSGEVVQVWLVRSPKDPKCPEFEEAAAAAIRQWKYEPYVVSNKAVPLCVMATTLIHFASK